MKQLHAWMVLGLVLTTSQVSASDTRPPLTPARYFECQLAARKASLAGMQELDATRKRRATQAQLDRTDQASRARVELALYRCRYNAPEMGAWAYRHQEHLKTWLLQHPEVAARMNDEARRISTQAEQSAPGRRPAATR